MDIFRQKSFQLKNFSSSTEKLCDFNCIAPKNQLKNFTDDVVHGSQNHNKPFGIFLNVNSSATYAILVNKSKVKTFKKKGCENS